jgi:hypothetical protein
MMTSKQFMGLTVARAAALDMWTMERAGLSYGGLSLALAFLYSLMMDVCGGRAILRAALPTAPTAPTALPCVLTYSATGVDETHCERDGYPIPLAEDAYRAESAPVVAFQATAAPSRKRSARKAALTAETEATQPARKRAGRKPAAPSSPLERLQALDTPALVSMAKGLGIRANGRWKPDTLRDRIQATTGWETSLPS